MQLEEFVSGTLTQIANGIKRANEALKNSDAKVNPPNVYPGKTEHNQSIYGYIQKMPQQPAVHLIQFDVAYSPGKERSRRVELGL